MLGKWVKSALSLVIVAVIVLSYSFIFQTAYAPPAETQNQDVYFVGIDSQNSFLTRQKNDTYDVYFNGQYLETIDQKEASQPPYSNLPITNEEE